MVWRKNASLKLHVQMLIKEGIAQTVAVLGASSSVMCQGPSMDSLYGVLKLETFMRLSRAIRPVFFRILLSQSHDPRT